ncbi:MAG TPA: MarR family transcriptional regulator [Kofleriaceae bacterium]
MRGSLGYALVRTFRAVNRASNRALRPLGLSAEQAHILLVLWLEGAMRMTELQRIVMLSSGTLTGAIDRMERAGMVRRVADADDGRAWRVEPAAADERRAIEGTLETIEESSFAALTATERRELRRLLDKVTASLA